MSRGGRPTERTKHEPHERHLIGPNVFLERIEDAGGVPESVLHGLRDSPQSPAAKDAADAMSAFTETLIQHLTATNPDAVRPTASDDPNRRAALMMSVMTSFKRVGAKEEVVSPHSRRGSARDRDPDDRRCEGGDLEVFRLFRSEQSGGTISRSLAYRVRLMRR